MEKEIKDKFKLNKEQNEGWSTYSCFAEAIREMKLSREIVSKLFDTLVQKKDYVGVPKDVMIDTLMRITRE